MPARDGTGPIGKGVGVGIGRQGTRRGAGRRLGGSEMCECPKCGYTEKHTRGNPCSTTKCPKCGTLMRGKFCK